MSKLSYTFFSVWKCTGYITLHEYILEYQPSEEPYVWHNITTVEKVQSDVHMFLLKREYKSRDMSQIIFQVAAQFTFDY